MSAEHDALLAPVNSVVHSEESELDKRAMNALIRKIDLRLIPLLILLSVINFVDRINIGIKRSSI